MSRAMNLTLSESDVSAICNAAGVSISAIEPLKSGGTRLVCTTTVGAEEIRMQLGNHLIAGEVSRYRFYRPTSR